MGGTGGEGGEWRGEAKGDQEITEDTRWWGEFGSGEKKKGAAGQHNRATRSPFPHSPRTRHREAFWPANNNHVARRGKRWSERKKERERERANMVAWSWIPGAA